MKQEIMNIIEKHTPSTTYVDGANAADEIISLFFGIHNIDQWSGLFDKNGKTLFEGDEVFIFGQKAKIVFELGAFCYQYNSGLLGIQTTPINGSNITIDSDFKCLDIEKIL